MNVSTFDSCKAIEEAARRRSDESMLLKISGVDLIAEEAKYRKHCRSQYVNKSNLMFVDFRVDGEEDVYTQAFQNLREDIKPELESGVALDMKTLLDSYQGILQHLGCNTAKSYKSERLKRRLQQSFQEEIVFQKLPDPSKPELVYSSSVSLQDVINSAPKKSCHLAKMSASSEDKSSNSQGQNDVNSTLYHAAQILRSSIRSESKSIGIQPVDVEDIRACKVKSLMPKDLYNFLCLMISNPDKVDVFAPTASNAADEQHILAISQDLIYATTHASLKSSFGLLCDKLPQLQQLFARFCTEASQQSKLFQFWNMYIDIVLVLLHFIRAEREGSWKLHLKAVAEMVPYFFSMDRINYSRYSAGSRTFKDLAERFFNVLFTPLRQGQCRRVDVVFDRYDVQESIKESERVRRGSSRALEIQIPNKHTPVPKQWGKFRAFISNQNNKVNLSRFFCREWCSLGE
ncbi:unnamed protein product [Porites lobata]|uniref:Uncharacterized protein n=1 Tax=Porites lobata TaxID=104759 RepID=A0ABN8QD03_9CNID|nr:unnamed protein product [Porites lobata]